MNITWKLFDRIVTARVFGDITFQIDEDGNAVARFKSAGSEYAVSIYNIVSISQAE